MGNKNKFLGLMRKLKYGLFGGNALTCNPIITVFKNRTCTVLFLEHVLS